MDYTETGRIINSIVMVTGLLFWGIVATIGLGKLLKWLK